MRSPQAFPNGTQLNWLARYVPIKEHLSGAALTSLLEVGSGARGISCVLPSLGAPRFVGIDMKFKSAPAPAMIPLSYDGGRLPLKDGAFHTVVSMDTLEHVPPPSRTRFLEEIVRVSSARVIVGFPSVTGDGGNGNGNGNANGNGNGNGHAHDLRSGQEGERFLQGLFRALGMGDPDWLHEHEELGLPSASDVEAILDRFEGWTWRRLKTTGNLVNLMAVLMDVLPGAGSWVQPVLGGHADELDAWFRAGMFGPASRAVYLLERSQPAAPLVTLQGETLGSLVRALCCPDCEGSLQESTSAGAIAGAGSMTSLGRLVCGGCARAFDRDPQGVVSLAATPGPVTFRLAPDWLGSRDWIAPVHSYLRAFSSADPCRLWLDLGAGGISAAEAVDLLQPILTPFGDRPFAELYLNDDPHDRPRGARVVELGAPATGEAAPPTFDVGWFRARAATTGGGDR